MRQEAMLITLARKPLPKGMTVAQCCLGSGLGSLHIEACRIGYTSDADKDSAKPQGTATALSGGLAGQTGAEGPRTTFDFEQPTGRWPANVLVGACTSVLAGFPEVKGQIGMTKTVGGHRFIVGDTATVQKFDHGKTDVGSAARFFFQVKGC
jgi:hypothetical protein